MIKTSIIKLEDKKTIAYYPFNMYRVYLILYLTFNCFISASTLLIKQKGRPKILSANGVPSRRLMHHLGEHVPSENTIILMSQKCCHTLGRGFNFRHLKRNETIKRCSKQKHLFQINKSCLFTERFFLSFKYKSIKNININIKL